MEKWRKERKRDREIDRKKKVQESAEAISGLKMKNINNKYLSVSIF